MSCVDAVLRRCGAPRTSAVVAALLILVEAIEEICVFERMLVEHVVDHPALDQDLADPNRFFAGEVLVAHQPLHRLGAHETLPVDGEAIAPIADIEAAGAAQPYR